MNNSIRGHLVLVTLAWQLVAMALAPVVLHCADGDETAPGAGAQVAADHSHEAGGIGRPEMDHAVSTPGGPSRHPHGGSDVTPRACHRAGPLGARQSPAGPLGTAVRPGPHCELPMAVLVALIGPVGVLPAVSVPAPAADASDAVVLTRIAALKDLPDRRFQPPRA
jgi:hypothetical protein